MKSGTFLAKDPWRGVTHYVGYHEDAGWRLLCRPHGRDVCGNCVTYAPTMPLCRSCQSAGLGIEELREAIGVARTSADNPRYDELSRLRKPAKRRTG